MELLIAAVIVALGTTSVSAVVAIITMTWKIGRWQARAEERAHTLCQRLTDFADRVEVDQKKTDADLATVHSRVDDHLRDHSIGPG